jgi:hypothetical protein
MNETFSTEGSLAGPSIGTAPMALLAAEPPPRWVVARG